MDRVEYHVQLGQDFTESAKKELYQANVYASKARKVRVTKIHTLFTPNCYYEGRSTVDD